MEKLIEQYGHLLWSNQEGTERIFKGHKFILYGENGIYTLGENLQETKNKLIEIGRKEIIPELPEE